MTNRDVHFYVLLKNRFLSVLLINLISLFFISCALVFLFSAPSEASRPVQVTLTGCVMNGLILSEKTDFGSHVFEGRYEIRPVKADGSKPDLSTYEGDLIQVKGKPLPGDRFIIDLESVRIKGPCKSHSSEGRIVFVSDGNILTTKTDGSDERQLTFSGQDRDPAISPDGKLIAYTSGHDELTGFGTLCLISVSGGNPKRLGLKTRSSAP